MCAVEPSPFRFPHYRGGRAARLRTFSSHWQDVFWAGLVEVREDGRLRWKHVQGHRQLTDVYLRALALANEGRLATFDSTISLRAVEGAQAGNLEFVSV